MTDYASIEPAEPAQPQLPVSAYLDPAQFALELEFIFKQVSLYIGHKKMVPNLGDWHTLTQENGGRALVHNQQGIELISNVCRHRQALLLGNKPIFSSDAALQPIAAANYSGNLSATAGNIVCPLHRWTYNNQGQLLGAPKFESSPACMDLSRYPLNDCHGWLFEGSRNVLQDLGTLFTESAFNFDDYVLDHIEIHSCHYNWKTFIEVYLENYHVLPFHPGLGNFVDCDQLSWKFGDFYSLQKVGVNKNFSRAAGSKIYQLWHDKLMAYRSNIPPDFGALWITYYPTHMIEIYPHVLVLSTLYPKSPQETLNIVEFYYPEEIVAFEREFVQAQRAAYFETAYEDNEIGERMDAGRQALMSRGVNEVGAYQLPLENGMQHFHKWYRQLMGSTQGNQLV